MLRSECLELDQKLTKWYGEVEGSVGWPLIDLEWQKWPVRYTARAQMTRIEPRWKVIGYSVLETVQVATVSQRWPGTELVGQKSPGELHEQIV